MYADLNFPAVAGLGSRLPKDNDTQAGPVYAEVKLKPLDTSSLNTCAATGLMSQEVNTFTKEPSQHKPGGRHCSRVCALAVGAVTILLLVTGVTLIIVCLPMAQDPSELQTDSKTTKGCPSGWTENRKSCYFFSGDKDKKTWNASMEECKKNGSKLVIINSKDELDFLKGMSKGGYYFLGLTYSNTKGKWNWIDDTELNTDIFNIAQEYSDYCCAVVGHNRVASADCNGSSSSNYSERRGTPWSTTRIRMWSVEKDMIQGLEEENVMASAKVGLGNQGPGLRQYPMGAASPKIFS
ncbi:C-type lectin domain family 5 member A isoform B [Alligator mississippiensis]|uniref:C-type lectin domain family 5 member A isoform B n=1 Tax=Alligator mississippiensis TaxID=8496 RepID=A0A151NL45_ALLMI|nr:C-type lectin domain family 5 member A isoform B [Alligator mississippiensis]